MLYELRPNEVPCLENAGIVRNAEARRAAWLSRAGAILRPTVSPARLSLALALTLALVYNPTFWAEVVRLHGSGHPRELAFLGSLLVLLVATFNLLFTLVSFRRVFKPAAVLILTLAALSSYFTATFGTLIDSTMIQNLWETDVREARDLLTPRLVLWVLLLGVVPSVLVLRSRIVGPAWPKRMLHRLRAIGVSACAILIAVVPFYGDYASLFPQQRHLRHLIAPTNFLYGTAKFLHERWSPAGGTALRVLGTDAQMIGRAGSARSAATPSGKKPVLILVIGETARAQQFSLNGYERETNPTLRAAHVFNFDNVQACGTSTAVSLPCMFSDQRHADYDSAAARRTEGLLDVLAHAGVDVSWRENNSGCKGACDRVDTLETEELWDDALCRSGECLDEVLLSGLDERLRSTPGAAVVVLHQQGSHGPAYYRRYPEAFRRFTPDCTSNQLQDCSPEEVINAYDNSILYTDHVLGQVIQFLKSRSDRYDGAMLYVSDHGESLGENNVYLHGLPYVLAPATQTRVPLVAWLSDGFEQASGIDAECLARRHGEPLSHDNLFHSVLGLVNVRSSVYDESLDLFAGCRLPVAPPDDSLSQIKASDPLGKNG